MDPAELRRKNFIAKDAFPYQTASGAMYDSGDYEGALDLALRSVGYEELRAEQQRRRDERRHARAGDRDQLVHRDHEPAGRGGVRRGRDHRRRRRDRAHGLVLARPGARDDLRDDRGRATRVADREDHGRQGRHGRRAQRARHVRVEVDADRRHGRQGRSRRGGRAREGARRRLPGGERRRTSSSTPALGRFHVVGTPQPALSWAELAERAAADGRLDELKAQHDFKAPPTFPFGVHIAVVEVDVETGKVELQRLVAVDDAGTLVNPLIAEGQVHGGVFTGVAQALFEEFVYDDEGNPLTGTFVGYAFPSSADLPAGRRSRWRRRRPPTRSA